MSDSSEFLQHSGARVPIICGAMYPCSNPELVAAASEAGAIGIIQPLTITYVNNMDLREGIRKIKSLTSNPVGFNVLVEKYSKIYLDRMKAYLDIALDEGIKFFITALGNPSWVIKEVEKVGGVVYHDVTEKKFAEKVADKGVKGLICVNNRAGGHLGSKSPEELYEELQGFGLPLVCAGGISTKQSYDRALSLGYQAVQMGTRFIATTECSSHESYKQAIVQATEKDIVSTERVTGVPLSVINNDYVKKVGTKAGPLARFLLKSQRTKHWIRMYYSVLSFMKLKKSNFRKSSTKDYWQAGKSVAGIHAIKPVKEVIEEITA
jgi:nitronate monooxygenase